jgi:hypothetical protein
VDLSAEDIIQKEKSDIDVNETPLLELHDRELGMFGGP